MYEFLTNVLYGFLGGITLNFMPCVLPVISLKVLSVLKLHSLKKYRANLLCICAGIFASLLILGAILVIVKAYGHYAGLGFTFQQPGFVICITLLVVIFAIAVGEGITIDLPHSLKNFLHISSEHSSMIGSFLSGAFATLLATPCTAPFLGTIVAYALTLNYAQIVIIFSSIALGMSLPFLLVCISPRLLNLIPKPGPWLVKFKILIQVMLYLTALWLIWVLSSELGFLSALALFAACVVLKIAIDHLRVAKRPTIKYTLVAFTILSGAILPFVLEDKSRFGVWNDFSEKKIAAHMALGHAVFVDITSDWCLTCKYNKKFVLETEKITNLFKERRVILLRGDFTKANTDIAKFLEKHRRSGIPFNIVFSKCNPDGLVLPTVLTQENVSRAVTICE